MSQWWVYIVPEDDQFHVGVTTDPPRRLRDYKRPATCYLRGPMVHKEAIQLQVTYNGMTTHEKLEQVFGLTRRVTA